MIDPSTNQDFATGGGTLSPTSLGSTGLSGTPAGTGASSGNGDGRIHRFAGSVHRAIDNLEQRLSSTGGSVSSTQARYGEQARQYGDRMRTRMNDQPLQSAGLLLAAGVLVDRLFLRKSKVRVVKVPVRTYAVPEPAVRIERPSHRWSDFADAHLQRAARVGQSAVDKAGMAAALGLAGTRATVSGLAREAGALPLHMRDATHRLLARSQEYGSAARSTVEAHPWATLGAVLAASGLLTTAALRGRDTTPGSPYPTAVDARGGGLGWQRGYDTGPGVGEMISSRPLTSGAVVLGLGLLAGALLSRRMP